MTRVGTGSIAAFIAAVLAAALLVACGGSSSDSSSTTSAASESGTPDTAGQSGSQRSSSENSSAQSGGHSQDQGNAQGGGSSGKSAKEIATPLKVSGGGSTQFRTKGGDNSIQEFGDEGDESELQEAAEVVHGFYVSRAAEEWGKACSYLAKRNIEQLEQLASQSPRLKNAGCEPILAAFTQPVSASVNREITTVDAGSLRHDGEQGFLIYYGAGHTAYAIPLANEDGTWKVAALSGSTVR